MKNRRIIIATAFCVIVFSFCKKNEFSVSESYSELILDYRQKVSILVSGEKYTLEYTDLEESRCEPPVFCEKAGFAKIKLKLEGEELELKLPDYERIQVNQATSKGVRIILRDVQYSDDKNFGKAKKSSVKLMMSAD